MANFERLFLKSKGKPISYKGDIVCMVDILELSHANFELTFESSSSRFRQGVSLKASSKLIVNDVYLPHVVLWQDTAPDTVAIAAEQTPATVQIKNVWDVGDGVIHSWHHGAAMKVVPLADGFRYFCNDGDPNDDFDDLVFRINLLRAT